MNNDFFGQILGNVLGNSGGGQQNPPAAGTGSSGGLGSILGDLMGGGSGPAGGLGSLGGTSGSGALGGGKGALMAMMLPLAMQWVQRSGGVGAVLQRFQQKGYSQQAASWVSTGANEELPAQAVGEVVGTDELSQLSQQLGVGRDEVETGMAQILPQVVNHLTPDGEVPHNSDDVLSRGISALEKLLQPGQTH